MTSPSGLKHLVLLGLGHAHVQVLQGLADSRPAELNLTVIAPRPLALYSGMVPGFVAGHYTLEQCQIPLEGLLARSGARFIAGSAVGLDANAQRVALASGETVAWDWLGVNTGPVMDRERIEAAMPGARRHALFVRPIDAFGYLWPQVASMASQQPIHLAMIGAGAAGVELALSAAHALRRPGLPAGSHVSLVTGGEAPAAAYSSAVQARVQRALRRLDISVIPETCIGLEAGAILLANGARLVCDAPLLAVGAQAPAWLADSGLALDDNGFVAVNAFQQSTSHPRVFAAGDVASRIDAPHPRSGVHAVRAGPPLLANLRAALQGQPLTPYQPPRRTLNLLACGDRRAIGSWGGFSFEGRWAWHWKDHIDRRFVARYAA
jgi:pyridine nucleotide-disulfide oxidoreductase family protein